MYSNTRPCLRQSVTTNIASEFIRLRIFNFFPAGLQPNSSQAASLFRFLGHTQLDTLTGYGCSERVISSSQGAATNTTHTKHKRRTSMPSEGIKPAISKFERLQTYDYGQRDRLSHPHIRSTIFFPSTCLLNIIVIIISGSEVAAFHNLTLPHFCMRSCLLHSN